MIFWGFLREEPSRKWRVPPRLNPKFHFNCSQRVNFPRSPAKVLIRTDLNLRCPVNATSAWDIVSVIPRYIPFERSCLNQLKTTVKVKVMITASRQCRVQKRKQLDWFGVRLCVQCCVKASLCFINNCLAPRQALKHRLACRIFNKTYLCFICN